MASNCMCTTYISRMFKAQKNVKSAEISPIKKFSNVKLFLKFNVMTLCMQSQCRGIFPLVLPYFVENMATSHWKSLRVLKRRAGQTRRDYYSKCESIQAFLLKRIFIWLFAGVAESPYLKVCTSAISCPLYRYDHYLQFISFYLTLFLTTDKLTICLFEQISYWHHRDCHPAGYFHSWAGSQCHHGPGAYSQHSIRCIHMAGMSA